MKNFFFISALAISFLFVGCATIVHGPNQVVSFASEPKGASLTIDGKYYGRTPKAVELRRFGRLKGEHPEKISYNVKMELDGYYPYELKVRRKVDGWCAGNILIGGLVGVIVDASTGSMHRLSPEQIIAPLRRQEIFYEEDDVLVKMGDSDDKRLKKYPKAKLIIYRRKKNEAEIPFNFSINSNISGSFIPNSYLEVDLDVTEKLVTIYNTNEYKSFYNLNLGAGEIVYLECSISEDNLIPQIKKIEAGNGRFYSDQAKYYQNKRENK